MCVVTFKESVAKFYLLNEYQLHNLPFLIINQRHIQIQSCGIILASCH